MGNEVKKMYENARIKPTVRDNAIGRGYYIEHQRVEDYPPFTAEKQLELIKWLVKSKSDVTICYSNVTKRFAISKRGGYCVSEDFATALVIKINLLWQDLTDGERKQIKEILE